MLKLNIPGDRIMELAFLALDYNGTIAGDGRLFAGVKDKMIELSKSTSLHVLTADTFGSVEKELAGIPCRIAVIPKDRQDKAKMDYIGQLGAKQCVGAEISVFSSPSLINVIDLSTQAPSFLKRSWGRFYKVQLKYPCIPL